MALTSQKYALIGAGPAGLAGAQHLARYNIPFDGYEAHSDVGGLWDIENPTSTMYESAHLISSKKKTEFTDFPMREDVADYPSHREMRSYFRDYAQHFGLYEKYKFNTKVKSLQPLEKGWELELESGKKLHYKGIIIANGNLSKPNIPKFKGNFIGEMIHSARYKSASQFEGKRVLIIGGGNSACDIAVDAVYRAKSVSLSMRRGYWFVPKYAFGKPADTIGGKIKLPRFLKQRVDTLLLRMFTGHPEKLGFPKPDYKLYQSHPVINSLVLHHAGHGDIVVKPDISHFEENKVFYKNGNSEELDMVVMATGYKLDFPFIENKLLNWKDMAPNLYLNIFHPERNDIFVLGMVEATGLGWQGRADQAHLIALFLKHLELQSPDLEEFIKRKRQNKSDTSGGYNYLKLARMAYYVHKDSYLKLLWKELKNLGIGLS